MTEEQIKQQEKIFSTWLSSKKALIVDPSGSSRAGLARTLGQLGAKTNNVIRCSTFAEAEKNMLKHRPSLVITEYDVGKRCGLDLLQKRRDEDSDSFQALFIMMTGNTSQSAVAQAAEEEVDGYILKPYTIEILRNLLIQTALQKLNPSEYIKKINEGKELVEDGKLEDAKKSFEQAIKLDNKPALAFAYVGQVEYLKKTFAGARQSYNKGLGINKIHYKCMTGLFDTFYKEKNYKQAYDIVKKLSRYFPANPERLSSVLHLAIITQSYSDVERYYQAFTNLDVRNEALIKYVCAALVVCGKYYLKNNSPSRALELFEKAGITSAGRPKILRKIILALMEYDLCKQSKPFLERFPEGARSKAEYLSMELLVECSEGNDAIILEKGVRLLRENVIDPYIYMIVIEKLTVLGKKDEAIDYHQKALKKWPLFKHKFDEAIK